MDPKNFFIETVQRLAKDNPKYFKKLSYVFFALLFFSGFVGFAGDLGVTLPGWVHIVNAKVLGWISAFGILFCRIPNVDVNENK